MGCAPEKCMSTTVPTPEHGIPLMDVCVRLIRSPHELIFIDESRR